MKKSKKNIKLFYLFLIVGMTCFSQTTTENWVKTTVYKQPFTNELTLPTAPLPEDATVQVSYFDGLGRPVQVINHAQSNTGLDIIQHIAYDALGRQTTDYLPFTDGTTNLNIRLNNNEYFTENEFVNAYNSMQDYENSSNPFSKKEFESSPLNRVLKQAAPGTHWALGSGHEIKFDYQTNAANQVRLFTFSTDYIPTTKTYDFTNDDLTGGSYYPANELYKTITRDENATATANSYTVEYKNKLGQVVLKQVRATTQARTTDNTQKFDTYYIYDDFGNLSFVLPPLVDKTQSTITSTVLDGLCYQYKYDYRNRLVAKKIPGKRWEYIVYDKLDRVRATGPSKSPFTDLTGDDGWLYTKYDVFDRPVLTSWEQTTVNESTRASLEDTINGLPLSETKTNGGSTQTVMGVKFHYNNVSYPSSSVHTLSINYYDNYNYEFPQLPNVPTSVLGQSVKDGTAGNCKTLTTGSWVRILEQSNQQDITGNFSTIFYKDDRLSSPVKTVVYYPNDGYTKTEMLYDNFEGKVLQTVTRHRKDSTISLVTTIENFTYSPQGRLITNTHKINTDPIENIVTNEYKELGELKTKHVGQSATTPLQIVDYTYNIRGWLTGINDITDLSVDTIDDLFAFNIRYNNPSDTNTTALYNGNISETYWRTSADNMVRKYKYEYDGLNRLLEADYRNNDLSIDNTYNEHLSYDKNGNILSLERNGGFEANNVFMIDNLVYNYDSDNLNQLKKVVDLTNSSQGFNDDATGTEISDTSDDYDYDLDGNMTKDENKDITLIKYNHLNLPTEIQFTNNRTINYTYDATGMKKQKQVFDGTYTTVTDYIDGYQYENKHINIGGRGYTHLLFFPHAEGYVKPVYSENKTLTTRLFSYVYNHTDHLGNIRVSYAKVDGVIEVLEENHYYPFGLKHQNYNATKSKLSLKVSNNEKQVTPTVENPFKYKYNGKELQDELGLNWYDYQARNYDPALGRWMNIDPLSELSRRFSPYTYTLNNPVYFIDPDGMLAEANDWIKNGDGTYTAEAGDSAWSLHTQHGVDAKVANDAIESQLGKNYKGKDGKLKSDVEVNDVVSISSEVSTSDTTESSPSSTTSANNSGQDGGIAYWGTEGVKKDKNMGHDSSVKNVNSEPDRKIGDNSRHDFYKTSDGTIVNGFQFDSNRYSMDTLFKVDITTEDRTFSRTLNGNSAKNNFIKNKVNSITNFKGSSNKIVNISVDTVNKKEINTVHRFIKSKGGQN